MNVLNILLGKQGLHTFSIKSQKENSVGLAGLMVSGMATNSASVVQKHLQIICKWISCYSPRNYLQKQVVGWIWPTGHSLPISGIEE